MTFGYVPPPMGHLWPTIYSLLNEAVERGENDWSQVVETLEDGRSQLWLTIGDKPVNATVSRMDGDTVEIWLCGGPVLNGSLGHLETILEAGREAGAVRARIIGRKGWMRALRPWGWHAEGDELVKDLA